jgi:hypothetical protein
MDVAQRLVARDPANADSQRVLTASRARIDHILGTQSDGA